MLRKSINIICIFILIAVGLVKTTSIAQAQDPLPVFHIAPDSGYACGAFWTIGEPVTLSIKDSGGGEIHQETKDAYPAWWDETGTAGEACFNFDVGLVLPGMTASMSEGAIEKVIAIVGLGFDAVAADGTASGTGPAGESGSLCLDWASGCNLVPIDGEGNWSGPLPGYDPVTSDLSGAHIKITDEDWDELVAYLPMEDPPPTPMFTVQPDHGWVGGWGWPVDQQVTLVVDSDLYPGNGILFSTTSMSFESEWEEGVGEIFFDLWDQPAHLEPGNYVSVSVGEITKVTRIVPLTFDAVSEAGIASGLGPLSGEGHACLDFDFDSFCEPISLVNETWTADFNDYLLNIAELRDAHVVVYDEDGDETLANIFIEPEPYIEVRLPADALAIDLGPDVHTVLLEVYSPDESELKCSGMFTHTGYDEVLLDCWEQRLISRSDIVKLYINGETEPLKVHQVINLTLDVFDPDSGRFAGELYDPVPAWVIYCNPEPPNEGCFEEQILLGTTAAWEIILGPDVVSPEAWFAAYGVDEDGDLTMAPLTPTPSIDFVTTFNWLDIDHFPPFSPVQVTIYAEETITEELYTNENGHIGWDVMTYLPPYTLISVDFNEGEIHKDLIVENLSVDYVDYDGDQAGGAADEGARIHFVLEGPDLYLEDFIFAGDSGWGIDFGVDYGIDLQEDMGFWVYIEDEDGDRNLAELAGEEPPPMPVFSVIPEFGWVGGWGWPVDQQVTLVVDSDLDPGNGILFSTTSMSFESEWEEGVGEIFFDLWDQPAHLEPGNYVSVSVGEITKVTRIVPLTFDAVSEAGIASGLGPQSGEGHACLDFDFDSFCEPILLDSGDWTADFSYYGLNIAELRDAHVVVYDDDGDETLDNLEIPPLPFMRVNVTEHHILALGWPLGSFLTLEIDDPVTSIPVDCDFTGTVEGYAPWDPGLTMLEFDTSGCVVQPDFFIRIFGAGITKEHFVTGLTIDGIDIVENTATGSTGPLTWVDILAIGAENEYLSIESGTDGNWTAFFSIDLLGDEIFLVWEWDGDGDATEVRWFPNNPPTAQDDYYSTNEDTVFSELTAGVLANDSDPDGDDLAMMLVDDVQFGVLEYNTDGTFSYTPDENYYGPDSFSYKAYDGELESNQALVTIFVEPVNDVPEVTLPSVFSIDEGQTFLGSGSFYDPDQDTWTATVDYGDGSGPVPLSLTTHQSFELVYAYLPSGVYPVTVTIHDGFSEGQASSELIVNNVAPAVSIDSLAGGDGSVLVGLDVSLLGSFIDPGADTHTALIAWGDGTQTVIDPAPNPLAASHAYQTPGLYTVTLTVTDDDGGVGSVMETLEVIEPAAAAEDVVDDLDTLLADPSLTPEATLIIEEALVDLEGANDGLSNSGALDKIVGGQWNAALTKIQKAIQDLETAEAADPGLDLSDMKELLALTGKSVTLEIIETAAAGGSPPTSIDLAYMLVAEGQALLDVGDYLGAVGKFLDAIHIL